MKLPPEARRALVDLATDRGVYLEGNVLKVLEAGDDQEFDDYLREATDRDTAARKKRLEVTKRVQAQNLELQEAGVALKEALQLAEGARTAAEQDLDTLQKKTQSRLMYRVVMVSLGLIVGVGTSSTLLYVVALATGRDTALLGNAWSSMLGILLTNSFSIIGTLMGVKYAAARGGE